MTTQRLPQASDDQPGRRPEGTGPEPLRWVVGIDGSAGARAALAWALGAAARTGATLELVTAYSVDFYWTDPYLLDVSRVDHVRDDAAAAVARVLAEVRADPAVAAVPGADRVPTRVTVAGGAAAAHLVDEAVGAGLLVVGSRGRGGVRSTLMGSVALHCVAHAPCPVVVVHPAVASPPARVVVGVEDSQMARAALAAAADLARRLDAELDIVAAAVPQIYWADVYGVLPPPVSEMRESTRAAAERVVGEVLGTAAVARLRVLDGPAAEVLVRAAAGAALLVVGSRSHSRIAGMMLGSVALHCAVQAPCPVMVVHPGAEQAADVVPDRATTRPVPVPSAG